MMPNDKNVYTLPASRTEVGTSLSPEIEMAYERALEYAIAVHELDPQNDIDTRRIEDLGASMLSAAGHSIETSHEYTRQELLIAYAKAIIAYRTYAKTQSRDDFALGA